MTPKEFAKELNILFDKSKWDYYDLADICHVSVTTVENWLRGENCPYGIGKELMLKELNRVIKSEQEFKDVYIEINKKYEDALRRLADD